VRVDSHVHAFADAIAERAMAALLAKMPPGYAAFDGRLATLTDHLETHGFDAAVLCSIATKPAQFDVIRSWSRSIREGAFGAAAARRIVPFLSVHPRDPDRYAHIEQTAREGYKGLKFHSYYQDLVLDSPEAIDLMRCAHDNGLAVLVHNGYDIAFPRDPVCEPARVRRLLDAIPGLKLIVSHFGGWMDWEAAEHLLIGQPIAIEISMTLDYLEPAHVRDLLLRHPVDSILYGSDWPWSSHASELALLDSLDLPSDRMAAMMGDNAARILGLVPQS